MRRIVAWQRRVARGMGISDGRGAAVTFIQRGGGALNVNVHFHTVVADGVFDLRNDGTVRFVPVLAPSDAEVSAICTQVATRVIKLIDGDDHVLRDDEDDALQPSLPLASPPALPPGPTSVPRPQWEHPVSSKTRCANIMGFSLHANTAVQTFDRAGLDLKQARSRLF